MVLEGIKKVIGETLHEPETKVLGTPRRRDFSALSTAAGAGAQKKELCSHGRKGGARLDSSLLVAGSALRRRSSWSQG